MFDKETASRACKEANRRARDDLLRPGTPLTRILPDVSRLSLFVLRREWDPFAPFQNIEGGWGLELQAERDPLIRLALRDAGAYEAMREIGRQALMDEIPTESFMTSLLSQVILGK